MGNDYVREATDHALTITPDNPTTEYRSKDAKTITCGNVTLKAVEFQLSVKLNKTRRLLLGTDAGAEHGVDGMFEIILTVKTYREGLEIDALCDGTKRPAVLTIGEAGDGLVFELPAAQANTPEHNVSDGSLFADLTFKATYDDVAGTMLVCTEIPEA